MRPALELEAIHKRFGAVEALAGATLRVREGTVHALLGENGAGKTTLMRAAYGMLRPDAGMLRIFGDATPLRSSADAIARGVGMVHQHFTLVPAMTVAENVALGMRGRFDPGQAAQRVRVLGQRTGLVLDPAAKVAELPVSAQQRLEIVKALAREARLLVLDEPTAVLAPAEAEALMRWVRRFRDEGKTVVLITHKLREALAIADDVTVLRRGATVLTGAAAALDERALVAALVGAEGVDPSPGGEIVSRAVPASEPIVVATMRQVRVLNERGKEALRDASLDVRRGEIVGVAAVEGAGQHEFLRVLAGRMTPSSGTVALPERLAFIPEDRHRDAMVLDMTLVENLALRGLSERRGVIGWPALGVECDRLLSDYDVRATSGELLGRELSGGNQQKFILGRELSDAPQLVVAENPTRGLDIRATAAVQEQLRNARATGCAVVMYSSDLDEVLALADRIVVIHAGRVRTLEAPTREDVARAMLGAS
ncbi:MAG: ATP-binding cassette domain-containing protein [Gemmatimonadaceae bacterium]|nr:ATP-binding cassette domain-containing protein [Gemmatimonadaceae bacterium]